MHAAVLDFTKAFGRAPHAFLMEKLSKIETFLLNRLKLTF